MMKKSRNIRKRAESDEEPEKSDLIPFLELDYHAQIRDIQKERSEKKKKKKEKSKEKEGGNGDKKKKKTLLSFDHDEHDDEDEVFQIKKSSHSKKMAKKARERQKQLKKEDPNTPAPATLGVKTEEKEPKKPTVKQQKGTGQPSAMILSGQAAEAMAMEQEDRQELAGERFPSLAPGMIPDAAMIHAARKRRQRAREMGDYIPLDDTKRFENDNSRMVREDDNDRSGSDSGDDEERMSFTVKQTTNRQRVREALDRKAQESDEASEGEHDEELLRWEQEQIKKGTVNVAQAPASGTSSAQDSPYDYQQYLYGQAQVQEYGYATSMSTLPAGGGYSVGRGEGEVMVQAPTATSVPTVLPTVNMEQVKKTLKERLESIQEVHRGHEREHDGIDDRLRSSASSTINLKDTQGDVSGQYGFFQEMRGYVRDLVECLNEKVPTINSLESNMHLLLKNRAQQLVERRQADIRDQSAEFMGAMMRAAAAPNLDADRGRSMLDDATQRRAAEREARRARRRRAREGRKQDKAHYEGMSSDDEQTVSQVQRFTTERDRIMLESGSIFQDVVEDFHSLSLIQSRFRKWKTLHGETYNDAYIGLCLPKLFAPFVRLQLLDWNPLQPNCPELEDTPWYESLLFYGFQDMDGLDPEDPDVKLLPSLVEKVLIPKLSYLVENVWDPTSSSQTHRLVTLVQRLAEDYPTVSARNKHTQGLLEALVLRMRKTLDDDVFMPLFPKSMIENKSQGPYIFLQRQFWACVKLLGNLLLWHGIVAEDPLRELALDGLLNRYLLLSLQNSDVNDDSIGKAQMIVATFPSGWFKDLQGDCTIRQLEPFCRYLVHAATGINQLLLTSSDLERRKVKMGTKSITKMLVNLHAMDHALSLSQDISLKDIKEMIQKT